MTERLLETWAHELETDPEFVAEGIAIDVTDEALHILEDLGHNQSWLANEMGVSRASVSALFNARPNLTLLRIARLAIALGVKPRILLDSDRWYIRSIDQSMNIEEVMTDIKYQQESNVPDTGTSHVRIEAREGLSYETT